MSILDDIWNMGTTNTNFDSGALKGDLSSSKPGSGLSGVGSGLKNTLEGDPAGAAAGLNALADKAQMQAEKVKQFLLGREAQAKQIYAPMQQMFGRMYGMGGLMPAQAPGVPGSSPYGGR